MQSIQLSFSIKPPIVKSMKNLDKVLINLANLTTWRRKMPTSRS